MLSIRKANNADSELLISIRRQAILGSENKFYEESVINTWAPPADGAKYLLLLKNECRNLSSSHIITYIAELNDVPVGFCRLDIKAQSLLQLYVLPNFQKRGIASILVSKIEEEAISSGIQSLSLRASLLAYSFYEHSGYQKLEDYNYILDNGLKMHCVMMEKNFFKRLSC